jgi:hypothetical protein
LRERSTLFRTGGDQVSVLVRVDPLRREKLVGTVLAVVAEAADGDGWLRLEVHFQDARHAEWALLMAQSVDGLSENQEGGHPNVEIDGSPPGR